jgi:hypothetical protein
MKSKIFIVHMKRLTKAVDLDKIFVMDTEDFSFQFDCDLS